MADGPGGGLTLADIWETFTSIWQAFIVPAGVLFAGAWKAYRWFTDRRDQKQRRMESDHEKVLTEAARERDVLSRDTEATMRRKDAEIAQKDRRIEELQIRADRYTEVYHEVNNLRQLVNSLQDQAHLPRTIWGPWSWTAQPDRSAPSKDPQ